MYSGRAVPSTTSREITTSSTPSRPGRSNMVSSRIASRIERNPRAPVLRSIALRATAPSASSAKVSSMFSISNSRWYCLTSAFFGSVRIFFSEVSSRSSSVATTGRRPTNSGIRPYLSRSSGSTWRKIPPVQRSSGASTCAPKPIEVERPRAEMIFSRPEKAPPQMNRMLVVSTCRNSCCGCLRPPCGGTDAIVPSMILSKACCTPSPETSRVMEGLSDLRLILIDLVDIDDAALGALDVVVGGLQQLEDDVLDVLADIAGFGQRGRISHGEGHIEDARERLRQQRLAGAGRADQQDV